MPSTNASAPWPVLRQSALPLRVRKKLGKFYRRPETGTVFSIRIFDQLYEGQIGNHIDDKIFLYGLHEASTVRLMRQILSWQKEQGQTPVLLDIGTNVGFHLIACAALADQAYGFEPWEPVRNQALTNLALNKDLSHVHVFDFGLSDKDEVLEFVPPPEFNHGVGLFLGEGDTETEHLVKVVEKRTGEPQQLPVRRGDAVLEEKEIVPTLLKIDVEGFERRVLTGLHDTLRTHKPAVIFEYSAISRKDLSDMTALEELFGPGYRYYGLARSREMPKLKPFVPGKKYENLLAWPESLPLPVL